MRLPQARILPQTDGNGFIQLEPEGRFLQAVSVEPETLKQIAMLAISIRGGSACWRASELKSEWNNRK
jgi:hypothetical protein